jgi:hypothetical protein
VIIRCLAWLDIASSAVLLWDHVSHEKVISNYVDSLARPIVLHKNDNFFLKVKYHF